MKIYVLGCGPAGLAAAHAVETAGHTARIYSKARKSLMFGAQYLHRPLPGINCGEPVTVRYTLHGTVDEYRRKVYGEAYDGTVSPQDLPQEHQAWDIRAAYDELWERYADRIVDTEINDQWLEKISHEQFAEGVISSVPLPVICRQPANGHSFRHIRIWAAGEAPELGKTFPRMEGKLWISNTEMEENSVICNGLLDPGWYRASLIFGRATVEWPWDAGFFLPEEVGSMVRKPIDTNCDCWPEVLRVGRYGTWTKGVLVHQAFERTVEWLVPGSQLSL